MSARTLQFDEGEYYHICNHGVEGRDLVMGQDDRDRFMLGLVAFNDTETIGSLYEQSFRKKKKRKPLVDVIAYCLNPNHFHLLLSPLAEHGLQKYLHRLCTAYAMYFNEKYKRKGRLFQGKFRARHISNNDDLLYTSVYVSRNNEVHQIRGVASKLVRSSWPEYMGQIKRGNEICKKDIIFDQFENINRLKIYADESLALMRENKEGEQDEEVKRFLLGGVASK